MKICETCKEAKPADSFWPSGIRRVTSRCKPCLGKKDTANRKRRAAQTPKLADDTTKTCSKCKQVKTALEFHPNISEPGGRHRQCKTCANQAVRASADKTGRLQSAGETLHCNSCDTTKPGSEFRYRKTQCRSCVNVYVRAKRGDPREFITVCCPPWICVVTSLS